MSDRPCGTLMILFMHIMMNEASNRLKPESSNDDDANDRMTVTSRELDTE